jgi:hypothetical protein
VSELRGHKLMSDWQPDGWWRVIDANGKLWSESSNEQENRERMRPGDTLQRHECYTQQRWVTIPTTTDYPQYARLEQAQRDYDQHVGHYIATRGRHSRHSCPLNTRAMCTFHMAVERARADLPELTKEQAAQLYQEQRERVEAAQEARMSERYSWGVCDPEDRGE